MFLILGTVFGLVAVVLGAFGSHALRAKLTAERAAFFETGVRYQMWHTFALFAVVLLGSIRFVSPSGGTVEFTIFEVTFGWPALLAGWMFVAGIVLFSGSLYALTLSERRGWCAVTPIGGVCLVLGWSALVLEAWVS